MHTHTSNTPCTHTHVHTQAFLRTVIRISIEKQRKGTYAAGKRGWGRVLNAAGVPRDDSGWRRKRDADGPMKRDVDGPMTTQPTSSDADSRAEFDGWVAKHSESQETFDLLDPAVTGKELVLPKATIWQEAFRVFDYPDHSDQANPGNPLPAKVCFRRSLIAQKIVSWVPATVDEYKRRYGSAIFSFRACVFAIGREVRAPVRTIAGTHTPIHTHTPSLSHTHTRTHAQYTMVPTKDELPAGKLPVMRKHLRENHPCFLSLADLESDLIVKAFAPLEEAPHDLPRFPTLLECLEADRAIKWWETLSQVTCTRTLARTHACTHIRARIPPAKPHLDMHVHEPPLPNPTLTCMCTNPPCQTPP